jgi:hypothetical protein
MPGALPSTSEGRALETNATCKSIETADGGRLVPEEPSRYQARDKNERIASTHVVSC